MRGTRWGKDVMSGIAIFSICAVIILIVSTIADSINTRQGSIMVSKEVNSTLDCDQSVCQYTDTVGDYSTSDNGNTLISEALYRSGDSSYETDGKVSALYNNSGIRNIVCWGDSITYGLGGQPDTYIVHDDEVIDASHWSYTDALHYYTHLNVYNLGVCGETSYDIALRQGGIKMYIGKQVTVRQGKSVQVSIVDEYGNPVILENFNGYETDNDMPENVVYINDTPFKLEYNNGNLYISMYGDNQSKSIKLKKGSQVVTMAAHDISGDVLVIQMGSNGGWDDYDELIEQYKAMIENSGTECYIIVGDTDNPDESIDGANYESSMEVGTDDTLWEAALRKAFGEHFINMRTYMIENALNITGKEVTEEDEYDLSQGRVPESLKYDYTHLNSYGYYTIGVGVYEKGVELGYWS